MFPARSAGFGSGVRPATTIEDAWEVDFLRFWAARDAMGFVRGGFIEISAVPWRNGRFARESAHTQWRQKRDFWRKKCDFNGKNVILTLNTWFSRQKSVFLPSGACLESKSVIFTQKKNMFCPAERALRANRWFWRQKFDFLNPLEPRSVLSKFDENTTVEKLSASSCSWW